MTDCNVPPPAPVRGMGVVDTGGGVACVTLTVTVAVVAPPPPVAVRVYVVDWLGNTRRLPVFCTVPMVWSMLTPETSPVTCQRKVEDCPISMLVGSAENCVMTGAEEVAAAGGGVVAPVPAFEGGGGGGGAGGCFLPQPAANNMKETARHMAEIWDRLNMKLLS